MPKLGYGAENLYLEQGNVDLRQKWCCGVHKSSPWN